ncbi:MAG: sulfatase-like hydrolase/transferase [Gammaproteobacteria bacterium]
MVTKSSNRLLKTLSIYTLVIVLLQFWGMLGYSFFTEGVNIIGGNLTWKILSSWPIMYGIVFFITVQFVIYAAFVYFLVWITRILARRFMLDEKRMVRLGIVLWAYAWVVIFLANQYFYPYSLFAFLPHLGWVEDVVGILLLVASVIALLIFLYTMACFYQASEHKGRLITAAVIVAVLLTGSVELPKHERKKLSKPNVVIIGIDAVRPDFVTKQRMPHVYDFLHSATNFTEATTPLARTFAAWVSILTGNYPRETHARYGLPTFEELNLNGDISTVLRREGYYTVFSIDERRFNNIDDEHFGFDQFIGNKMGFDDFFIGTINDFPLTNLFINTRLGKYLFPYTYANRSSYPTYSPSEYVARLDDELNVPSGKPLFLGIHICLPHWNWLWSKAPFDNDAESDIKDIRTYEASLKRADEQFYQIMKMLARKKLLNNAIVVLMSDHGQSFAQPSDALINKDHYVGRSALYDAPLEDVLQPVDGHGTSVIDMTQYRNMLAFKRYNGQSFVVKDIDAPVNLIDIAPTILNVLNMPIPKVSGISLLPYLKGDTLTLKEPRTFFLETGFTLPGILLAKKSLKAIMAQSISYFDVETKTGRLVMRPNLAKIVIAGKQRAEIYGKWMLVYYPTSNRKPLWLLINTKTGMWTDDLHGELAKAAPVAQMLASMHAFYGEEIQS